MNDLIKAIVLGVARNGAALAGGWLVSHGVTDGAEAQSFIGSVCFLAALAFTAWDKLIVKHKISTALASPAPVSSSAAPSAVTGADQ